jgi:ATP-binding cassette subfamily B protein
MPRLKGNITRTITAHLLQHSYQYYQNTFAGSLANKVNDVSYGVAAMTDILFDEFVSNFLAIVIATGVLFTVNKMVALFFIMWSVIFLIGTRHFALGAHHLADAASELRSRLTGNVVDLLSNMSIVRLFSRQTIEKENIRGWTQDTVEAERKFSWQLIKLFSFQSFSSVIMQAMIMFYLVYARSHNQVTIGDFALVFTITIYITTNVWTIGRQLITFAEQSGKVTQGLRITMQAPTITDIPDAKVLEVTKGEVKFENVTFGYHRTKPLFSGLSVEIPSGQKLGLVGYSGSGKTTFANLILRLFDINSGAILIDGQNIAKVAQRSLREKISLIPQDPTLFHRTLYENIAYGQEQATPEEVMVAAKAAHAHEFIEKIPTQYEALVGERGIKLSGGQRQRIAIARAILKNAPLLILDEATSSLDSVTEQLIQESLLNLMQNKTTIVIAHRLSTLLHMDRILVFDSGRIVEEGTHATLLAQGGLYAKLWNSQIQGFLPEVEEEG